MTDQQQQPRPGTRPRRPLTDDPAPGPATAAESATQGASAQDAPLPDAPAVDDQQDDDDAERVTGHQPPAAAADDAVHHDGDDTAGASAQDGGAEIQEPDPPAADDAPAEKQVTAYVVLASDGQGVEDPDLLQWVRVGTFTVPNQEDARRAGYQARKEELAPVLDRGDLWLAAVPIRSWKPKQPAKREPVEPRVAF